jgi:hypothetical protein
MPTTARRLEYPAHSERRRESHQGEGGSQKQVLKGKRPRPSRGEKRWIAFGFLAKVLRDDTLFHTWLVRAAVAAFWHPPRDWYKPRVEYVKREMSHSH